jgi:UDPglucose--hexose-1-phosphate uridylyltransferase
MIEPMELLAEGPHRRYDPLRDAWVLVSPGRTNRPWSGAVEPVAEAERPAYDADCYLCPGNRRASGEVNPAYQSTFVFTNDYAALQPSIAGRTWDEGLLRAESVAGTCRVICFSPRHDRSLGNLPPAGVRAVVDTWADQSTELGQTYKWVQVFENRGMAMGASNPHPHGQIWAQAALPTEALHEQTSQARHWRETGRPLLLDYGRQEASGERRIYLLPHWQVVVPFWAVWPFETLVLPRRPVARLADLDGPERDGLVAALQALVAAYDRLFGVEFPYSMGWHQSPFGDEAAVGWTLHAHFYPPLLRSASVRKFMVGYELLSEPQRDLDPEEAAEQLRAVR